MAALLLELVPTLTPVDIENALTSTAIDMDDPFTPGFDVGFDHKTGFGLIQADGALCTFDTTPPTVTCNVTSGGRSMRTASVY